MHERRECDLRYLEYCMLQQTNQLYIAEYCEKSTCLISVQLRKEASKFNNVCKPTMSSIELCLYIDSVKNELTFYLLCLSYNNMY